MFGGDFSLASTPLGNNKLQQFAFESVSNVFFAQSVVSQGRERLSKYLSTTIVQLLFTRTKTHTHARMHTHTNICISVQYANNMAVFTQGTLQKQSVFVRLQPCCEQPISVKALASGLQTDPWDQPALKGLFVQQNVLFYHSKPVTAAIIQIPIHFWNSESCRPPSTIKSPFICLVLEWACLFDSQTQKSISLRKVFLCS